MDISDGKMEWAYLDGELSAAEAADFDRSLSEEERERLASEMQLEALLAERLSDTIVCPNHVWVDATARIKKVQRRPRIRFWRRLTYGLIPLTAAALLLVILVLHRAQPTDSPVPQFLLLPEGDVSALAAHAQVSEAPSDVRDFLNQRAVQVSFDPANLLDSQETPYMLLGACENEFEGETLIELLFSCGEYPAKVVIVRQSGPAAEEVGKAIARGKVRASRPVGNSLIAVVGANAPADLLSFIAEPWIDIPPEESQENSLSEQPNIEPQPESTPPEPQAQAQQGQDVAAPPAPPKYFRFAPGDNPLSFT